MTDKASDWRSIETAPKDGTPVSVRGDGWPVTAVWVAEPHHTFGWVFADPEGKPLECEREGSLTYVTLPDPVTEWKPLARDPAPIALGTDLRDFLDHPITVEEMASAIERAHRDHLAAGGVADLHAVMLQEASKALRRAGRISEAAAAQERAQARFDAARRAFVAALRNKPDGRDL